MSGQQMGDTGFGNPPKIDNEATLGIFGTPNSLAYRQSVVDRHLHSGMQSYGALSASNPTMTRGSLVPMTVASGNGFGVWDRELLIYRGTAIEGGSATMQFDIHWTKITAVGVINTPALYHFNSFEIGTPTACTFSDAGNTLNDATNTLANNDKLYLASIASNTGITLYECYYVINRNAAGCQLSYTRGGGAVNITGADGAGTYVSLGATTALGTYDGGKAALQTWMTDWMVSRVATTVDTNPSALQHMRLTCNKCMSVRGYSSAANSISMFVGLHTYAA